MIASENRKIMQALNLNDPKLTSVISAISGAGITDHKQIAQILANLHLESGAFELTSKGLVKEENLNYTAKELSVTFPTHFRALGEAEEYAAKGAEAIANRVYANRMGNGDESSGDGWTYRGRGRIQLTGKDNYAACTMNLDHDFLSQPENLSMPEWADKSAIWFLTVRCGDQWLEHAAQGNCQECRRLINGGENGLPEVVDLYGQYLKQLEGANHG